MSPVSKSPEKEESEYIDFDFDSELDFVTRRKKREADRREIEKNDSRQFRRSFEEPPAGERVYWTLQKN
ncbi:hypothetical protein MASR1M107_33180 [Ignavibacteriales bacterium]